MMTMHALSRIEIKLAALELGEGTPESSGHAGLVVGCWRGAGGGLLPGECFRPEPIALGF